VEGGNNPSENGSKWGEGEGCVGVVGGDGRFGEEGGWGGGVIGWGGWGLTKRPDFQSLVLHKNLPNPRFRCLDPVISKVSKPIRRRSTHQYSPKVIRNAWYLFLLKGKTRAKGASKPEKNHPCEKLIHCNVDPSLTTEKDFGWGWSAGGGSFYAGY
jgi:hypothetical protein